MVLFNHYSLLSAKYFLFLQFIIQFLLNIILFCKIFFCSAIHTTYFTTYNFVLQLLLKFLQNIFCFCNLYFNFCNIFFKDFVEQNKKLQNF